MPGSAAAAAPYTVWSCQGPSGEALPGTAWSGSASGAGAATSTDCATGLRAALTPIVTIFGLDFGLLIGSAVLTETVFGLPGLGQLAIDGTKRNDLPQVLGVVLLIAVFVAVANLVVDLLYAVIDPRVRTR